MPGLDYSSIILYDWMFFFRELTDFLVSLYDKPGRNQLLKDLASRCFGENASICKYQEVDPFSFIYFLAQRNTVNQKTNIYNRVIDNCEIKVKIPTDWIFPSPSPSSVSLFHGGADFKTDLLWDIFKIVKSGKDINDIQYKELIKIKTVKTTKLTQTLFLIDPSTYLPIDDRTSILFPLKTKKSITSDIESVGITKYFEYIKQVRTLFPNCELYEVNLLCYLIQTNKLSINNSYYQIGSNVFGETDKSKDHKQEFFLDNKVWVGGATSGGKGKKIYPIMQPIAGDVILSHFNRTGNGIGVVIDNEYQMNDGFGEDLGIKVIWINKAERDDAILSSQAPGFSRADKFVQSFRQKYPETFQLLNRFSNRSTTMPSDILNLIIEGPPGTGKTRLAKQLALYLQAEGTTLSSFLTDKQISQSEIFTEEALIDEDQDNIKIIQFHPGYTYEDFVRGIMTEIDNTGRLHYRVENKILAKIANQSEQDLSRKYVLIVDEINRANLPAVLGELIYALEYRGEAVQSPYKNPDSSDDDSTEIILPENLYIIGTMNTADRSIGRVDYAIRRRFIFHSMYSNIDVIHDKNAQDLFQKVKEFIKRNISSDFNPEDVMIGHSYFLPKDNRSLQQRWDWEIKPLLFEYVKDGILVGNDLPKEIENLN
jgi:nucleoside-triphosphatase THEP1